MAAPPWADAAIDDNGDPIECECRPVTRANSFGYCPACGGFYKGVDDFLRAGGELEELVVLVREVYRVVDALRALYPFKRRFDASARSARALYMLPLFADQNGALFYSLKTFARVLGWDRKTARRAVVDLAEAGVIEVEEGSLEAGLHWPPENPQHDWDWYSRPRIRFRPEFQAVQAMRRLGEIDDLPALQGRLLREELEREVDALVGHDGGVEGDRG